MYIFVTVNKYTNLKKMKNMQLHIIFHINSRILCVGKMKESSSLIFQMFYQKMVLSKIEYDSNEKYLEA